MNGDEWKRAAIGAAVLAILAGIAVAAIDYAFR